MDKDKQRQIAVILATILALIVNVLANILPFNGQTTGEISNRFNDFFTPAGYVFAIWGVIYVGFIAFTVFHSVEKSRWYPRMQRIGWLWVLSCVLNAAWLLFWHYNYYRLSLIDMLALLVTLIVIYLRLDIGAVTPKPLERWCVDIPISIYLGWISVAAIANLTDVLSNGGWFDASGSGVAWALAMLVLTVLLGAAMFLTRTDVAYLLVLTWALAGVAVNEAGMRTVGISAWIAAGLALLLAAASVVWRMKNRVRER